MKTSCKRLRFGRQAPIFACSDRHHLLAYTRVLEEMSFNRNATLLGINVACSLAASKLNVEISHVLIDDRCSLERVADSFSHLRLFSQLVVSRVPSAAA